MKGVVLKAFPFAFDGNNFTHLKVDDDFPPLGYAVKDGAFNGLVDAGYIRAVVSATSDEDVELNRQLIEAIDKRLSAMSDEDLKGLIARRGTPFSGNLVHAVLVSEAKVQLLAEYQGAEPVTAVDPDAGVTEQPLSAPGQATPPSAAAAVAAQQVQQDAAKQAAAESDQSGQQSDPPATNQQPAPIPATDGEQQQPPADNAGNGGTPTTDQFGENVDLSKSGDLTEAELNTMNKTDLEAYAAKKGVDLSQAKTKADYVEALKPKTATEGA